MSYDPNPIPADGTITTAKLGGDVTTLAKDLLQQATTTDAKDTLAVVDPNGLVPAITV